MRVGRKVLAFYLFTLLFSSCQANDGKCHIIGTVIGEQYEGKRIFLVPNTGPATMETVDSMEITNGKFHFEPDSMQMYKILVDYHYRMGLQPLLVVGEPGIVNVIIDSISHATGTPQNDSEKVIIQRADSFHLAYKNYTRQLAKNMEGLVLGDFLKELFPLTYKRKLPDGRIVTMNADTNEEIPE